MYFAWTNRTVWKYKADLNYTHMQQKVIWHPENNAAACWQDMTAYPSNDFPPKSTWVNNFLVL